MTVGLSGAANGVAINGHSKSSAALLGKLSKDHDLVLKTFRMLIADLCQQFGGGHPGYADSGHYLTTESVPY
jgi:dihydroxyacetone synthase